MPMPPGISDVERSSSAASLGARPPLPRTVILLGWVSFFADVSGEMVYPLLPLFIVGVLGASATALGWVEGVAMALVATMTAWAGWRSDRGKGPGLTHRTPWIRWGYGIPVLGKAILALSVVWPMVLIGRAIDRIGKGLRGSPRDALIADATDPPERGRAFGFHRMMDTAGATIGAFTAAGLLWWLRSPPGPAAQPADVHESGWAFRLVFGIAAALGLAALALTFFIREKSTAQPIAPAGSPAPERPSDAALRGGLGLPRSYWLTIAALLVFAIANSSDTFLLLRAKDVGLSAWAVVLAYALYNVTYTVFSYPAGVVSDRIGRWRVIALGWALYAFVYAGFAWTNALGVWALMPLYGVYVALTDGVGKALIADHAPKNRRGTAMGLFYMATGFTTLASSVLAGLLWDKIGHAWPFLIGAGAAVVALAIVPFAAALARVKTQDA